MRCPVEGGCACCDVRYQLLKAPPIVNCCHCRWCERETGASFALNTVLGADQVVLHLRVLLCHYFSTETPKRIRT